jgi:uncharacterized damage-inducible protein DinB
VPDRFAELGAEYLGDLLDRIERSVTGLTEAQIWWRANPATNSIGNLLLHLQGNLSQWVLAALGGQDYERHRSQEFAARGTATKAALLAGLRAVVTGCQPVIRGLAPAELARFREIQGGRSDGFDTVLHVVEHMSYHTGQIIHIAKELLGPEGGLDFYPQHRDE